MDRESSTIHRMIRQDGSPPDRLFITSIRPRLLDLRIDYQASNGTATTLGSFRLPMDELSTSGQVRRRVDGQGYDIQIRIINGEPWFWLNKPSSHAMRPWRVDGDRLTTLQSVSDVVNARARGHDIGRLQEIRARLKGLPHAISSAPFPATVRDPQYTWHVGGRAELQFNLGYDRDTDAINSPEILRHGVAFSFEPSRSLPSPEVDLLPYVRRFNSALADHLPRLEGIEAWSWYGPQRSPNRLPCALRLCDAERGRFVFFGWKTKRDPSFDDISAILDHFDLLVPLYLEVLDPNGDASLVNSVSWQGGPTLPPPRSAIETTANVRAKSVDVVLRHALMQRRLYDELVAEHGIDKVWWERPTARGTRIDLAVDLGSHGGLMLFEIKTAESARACIREAMGQLLEYSHWPGELSSSRLVVVGEPHATTTSEEYLATLRRNYGLQIEYRQVLVA